MKTKNKIVPYAKAKEYLENKYKEDIDEEIDNTYANVHRRTPLHMAVQMKNAASINVMLKFMARFEYAVFRTFGRIVPELIQYSAFKDLIEG
jgi:predicted alternative tryptophan synthase beta-subunit